jgi:hypothetical protein
MVRQRDGSAGSFRGAVTLLEEVRPVNVVSMWVLPLVVTDRPLT